MLVSRFNLKLREIEELTSEEIDAYLAIALTSAKREAKLRGGKWDFVFEE